MIILLFISSRESNQGDVYFRVGDDELIMYLSLCGPIQLSRRICPDLNSKVCIVKKSLKGTIQPYVPDAGSALSSKNINNNNLELEFISKAVCPSNKKYLTRISFVCTKTVSFLKFF